jgi:beta-N-acetylglucosaminidase
MKDRTVKNRIQGSQLLPVMLLLVLLWALGTADVSAASYATPGTVTASINASGGTVLRARASTSSKKVKNLSNNTKITIYYEVYTSKTSTDSQYHWYRVSAGKSKGYVLAKRVDGIQYNAVLGKVSKTVPARKGPSGTFRSYGNLSKGKVVSVYMKSHYKGSDDWWMKIKVGEKVRYVRTSRLAKVNNSDFEAYLTSQGFPASYKKALRKLHNEHPNWVFKAKKTNLAFNTVLSRETRNGVSLVYKSYPKSYRDKSSYSYKNGKYIAKDGSSWYNASKTVVAYYLDPRNFLDDTHIYMFLSLNYHSYQTTETVNKVLSGTQLPKKGFSASMFVSAGKKYEVSPIFLASRAKQETGGGSIAINGYKYKNKTVYNPFNIGATSGSNPVVTGLKYAYKKGWTTRMKAVNGGAELLEDQYIGKKQNTIYYQRFNVKNGWLKAGTHQYMTNIMAPYYESASMKTAYTSYGLTDEKLVFEIPVYKSMPSSTSLPKK